jgi:hypothetical protein
LATFPKQRQFSSREVMFEIICTGFATGVTGFAAGFAGSAH